MSWRSDKWAVNGISSVLIDPIIIFVPSLFQWSLKHPRFCRLFQLTELWMLKMVCFGSKTVRNVSVEAGLCLLCIYHGLNFHVPTSVCQSIIWNGRPFLRMHGTNNVDIVGLKRCL